MNTVLKKAGIVVATAAAGLLAVSPLAFAGDYAGGHDDHGHHHSHHGGHHHKKKNVSCKQDNSVDQSGRNEQRGGLLNVQNTNVQVPVQACNNSVVEGVLGILAKGQKNSDSHGK